MTRFWVSALCFNFGVDFNGVLAHFGPFRLVFGSLICASILAWISMAFWLILNLSGSLLGLNLCFKFGVDFNGVSARFRAPFFSFFWTFFNAKHNVKLDSEYWECTQDLPFCINLYYIPPLTV